MGLLLVLAKVILVRGLILALTAFKVCHIFGLMGEPAKKGGLAPPILVRHRHYRISL